MELLNPSWYLTSVFLGLHEPVPFSSNIMFQSHSCSTCTFSSQLRLRSPATMHSCAMIFQLPIGLHTHDYLSLSHSGSQKGRQLYNVVVVWFSKFNTANHWLQNSYHPSFTSSPIAPDISSNAHQTEFPLSSEGPCFQPIPSAILTHNTSLHAVYHQYFNACDQNSGGEGSNVP